MSSNVANDHSYKKWIELYDYKTMDTVPEIVETDSAFKIFFEGTKGDDIDGHMDSLIDFPLAGFAYAKEHEDQGVEINVVHHVFRTGTNGLNFDNSIHSAYGFHKWDSNDEVVKVEPAHIRFVNPMVESIKTPKLSDFLKAAANRSEDENYKIITANLAQDVPDEWISNGMDDEGYPLPFLMPRFGVPILPFMFPAFNPTFSAKVTLMCLIELSMRYAAKHLSVRASKDFFAHCFPVFQSVWYWTTGQEDISSLVSILEADDEPVIATDPKVMKVARSIKVRWISDEVVVGTNNATSPLAAAPPGTQYVHTTDPSVTKVLAQNCDIQAQMIQLLDDKVSGQGIKSWASRFHISFRRAYQFAAATATDSFPSEPNEEYKTFLESRKDQLVGVVVQHVAHQRGGSQVINTALATMLYGMNFCSTSRSNDPEGLSVFFSAPSPIRGEKEAMSIEEINRLESGKMLSAAQIKALTNPTIQVPLTDNAMRKTVKNHLRLLDFVFGQESIIYKNLKILSVALEDHDKEVATMCIEHEFFIASVLQKIDKKCQNFFLECARNKDISTVDYGTIDFANEIRKIKDEERLEVVIPEVVKDIIKASRSLKNGAEVAMANQKKPHLPPAPNNDDRKLPPKTKKEPKAKRPKAEGGGVKNPNPVKDWLVKSGDEYKDVFFKNIPKAPRMNGQTICAMFHLQGHCAYGENCLRKESHGKLSEDLSAEMSAWVAKCRFEANTD